MRYNVNIVDDLDREWEIIAAENFSFVDYYQGKYDIKLKFGLLREAWLDSIPLYLHGISTIPYDELIIHGQEIVTPEPIFAF